MPRLDQDQRIHEFTFEGKEYRAVYSWALNSIWIDIKTADGWEQIDANTQLAFNMIRKENITWGDYRAPIKRSERETVRVH
jgi:hypothetical protein